jgi:hypothetical protein
LSVRLEIFQRGRYVTLSAGLLVFQDYSTSRREEVLIRNLGLSFVHLQFGRSTKPRRASGEARICGSIASQPTARALADFKWASVLAPSLIFCIVRFRFIPSTSLSLSRVLPKFPSGARSIFSSRSRFSALASSGSGLMSFSVLRHVRVRRALRAEQRRCVA